MLAFSILYLIIERSCEGSAGLFDLKIPLVKVDKVFLWLFSFPFTLQGGLCAGAQSEALSQARSTLFPPQFTSTCSLCCSALLLAWKCDPSGITIYIIEAPVEHKSAAEQDQTPCRVLLHCSVVLRHPNCNVFFFNMKLVHPQRFKAIRQKQCDS